MILDLEKLQGAANKKLKAQVTELATAIEDGYHIYFELLTTSTLTTAAQDDLAAYNRRQLAEDDKISASIILVDSKMIKARLDEALNHVRPYIDHDFQVESDKILNMKLGKTKVAVVALPLRECLITGGV